MYSMTSPGASPMSPECGAPMPPTPKLESPDSQGWTTNRFKGLEFNSKINCLFIFIIVVDR